MSSSSRTWNPGFRRFLLQIELWHSSYRQYPYSDWIRISSLAISLASHFSYFLDRFSPKCSLIEQKRSILNRFIPFWDSRLRRKSMTGWSFKTFLPERSLIHFCIVSSKMRGALSQSASGSISGSSPRSFSGTSVSTGFSGFSCSVLRAGVSVSVELIVSVSVELKSVIFLFAGKSIGDFSEEL